RSGCRRGARATPLARAVPPTRRATAGTAPAACRCRWWCCAPCAPLRVRCAGAVPWAGPPIGRGPVQPREPRLPARLTDAELPLLLLRGAFLRGALLRRRFLRGGFLRGGFLRGAFRLGGRGLAADLEELARSLHRDAFDGVALAQGRVRLAVGDVGAEAAVLHDDRLARGGI